MDISDILRFFLRLHFVENRFMPGNALSMSLLIVQRCRYVYVYVNSGDNLFGEDRYSMYTS